MSIQSYACYARDNAIRLSGSSGGIYYLIAEDVILNGGVVYAVCYDNNLDVVHRRIDRVEDIAESCGSKYAPSDICGAYRSIGRDLDNGLTVLFVGTPCQCAGVISRFGGSESLLCVDFVCHGMPSSRVWRSYLDSVSSGDNPPAAVNMRDKTTGWQSYSFSLVLSDGTTIRQPHLENPYIKGMLNDLYLRPSCYSCAFKGIERKTDITLGDMWGIERICPELYSDSGVSLVITHSARGRRQLDGISDKIHARRVSAEECARVNTCMVSSVARTEKRDSFFRKFNLGEPLEAIVGELTRRSLPERLRAAVRRFIIKK